MRRLLIMRYKLDPVSIGDETYIVMSRGHHDPRDFMHAVRENYQWPLGFPTHEWMRCIPAKIGSGYDFMYVKANPGSRGAFPCTVTREAYHEERYDALVTQQRL